MSPLTLEDAAALAGNHCWAERRLFEVLGGWSAVTHSAGVTLALDRHAQHAAWRAEQWWDRLPVLAGVDRDALVAPGRAWGGLETTALDEIAAIQPAPPSGEPGPDPDDDPTLGRADVPVLAVAYRVLLPRLVVAYARHLRLTTPVADGPAVRTLGHVRPDAAADWAEGEALLQERLVDVAAVDLAATATAAAERRLVP